MADVIDTLFGPTPLQIAQAQNAALNNAANSYAAMNPEQRATSLFYKGGGMLAGPVAEQFGMVNPAIEEARRRQAVMASGGDLSTSAGLKAKAAQFAQAGDQATAMKLLMVARKQEMEESKIALEQAQAAAALHKAQQEASPLAKIDPSKYTPESVKAWFAGGMKDPSMLVAVDDKEKSPTSYREWELAGKPGTFDAWLLRNKKAGATSVMVSTGKGDSKYAEKRLSDAAEQLTALGKSAESAWKANQALERFEQASASGTQGGAQPLITATQNLISSFGYTSDALKDTRQMEQAIGDILGNKMAELGARGLTDKDMEVLRQSLPRVDTDRGSRNNVVAILKKANQSILSEYENARVEEARVYPDLSTRITNPGWYKAYKAKTKTASDNPVASIPTEQTQNQMNALPPPAQFIGKVVRDTVTGKRYKSDGSKWVLQ